MDKNIARNLLEKAKLASNDSYSPYSQFPVGACILLENDKEYIGCNVENASFGLSLCAERNAISTAIANGETSKIKAIAVYSSKQRKCLPCGACRQWLYEFCKDPKKLFVVLEEDNRDVCITTLEEIFPSGFKFE